MSPREASDRLFVFQNRFDNLYRKYLAYTNGEELFGLSITEYPELMQIKYACSTYYSFEIDFQIYPIICTLYKGKNSTCCKNCTAYIMP